jgi:hypothetical protein
MIRALRAVRERMLFMPLGILSRQGEPLHCDTMNATSENSAITTVIRIYPVT